jgi:hypothetical protein
VRYAKQPWSIGKVRDRVGMHRIKLDAWMCPGLCSLQLCRHSQSSRPTIELLSGCLVQFATPPRSRNA